MSVSDNTKFWILAVLLVLNCVSLGYRIGHDLTARKHADAGEVSVVSDTLVVHDTVRIAEPVEVERKVVKTVYVPAVDTLTMHDTLYVRLEREQKEYADTNYRAYVSGIRPQLDSIFVFPATRYVTTTVTTDHTARKQRWGLGVQAGYGISTQGFVPYIGIGISYNILTF